MLLIIVVNTYHTNEGESNGGSNGASANDGNTSG